MNEEGDGGDSDEEAEDVNIHTEARDEVVLERTAEVATGNDDEHLSGINNVTSILLHQGRLSSI